jgi:nucleotide-binding universal stress UspA family protein
MSVELIVVGLDNSPGSCTAVRWAAELAGALGARVIAVHAFEPLDHLDEIKPGTDFAAVREDIEEQLRADWCRPLAEVDVEVETVIKEGRPADVILAVAREVNADLIVLGARRMGWLRELTLGSTSHRVLHEANRPVTIIHSQDE